MKERDEQTRPTKEASKNKEINPASTPELPVAPKEGVFCKKCLREFKSKSGLWKHRRKHKMENPEEGKKSASTIYRGDDSRHH